MNIIRIGVIGTNKITDKFLEAGKGNKEFQLKAVYSRTPERALEYAGKHGADLTFNRLEGLAECREIDAVYIASPNSLHASQSILMMKHGKHVLCEKPIAGSRQELRQMTEAAKENKVVLLEAMRSVFSPGFQAIKENLHKLGIIRRATFQYCQYSSRYDNFKRGIVENALNPQFSNGALMDLGVYCIHPIAALFGKPSVIKSSSLKLSNGIDGAGTALLEYPGMQAELLYSKISDSKIPSQIQGEDGTMVIREISNPQAVTIYYRNGETEELDFPGEENNMCYEIETFIHLIKENKGSSPYREYSELELEIMDEIRRQQVIIFPNERKG